MANKGVVKSGSYTFTPGGANVGTITFTDTAYDSIALSDIMLVTNVKSGTATIIYDPFDSTKGGSISTNGSGRKVLTLATSTSSMSNTDPLQIIIGYTDFSNPATESTLADVKTSVQLIDDSVATAGSTASTKAIQVAGTDGNNARILSTNASGHVNIADGGNSITVDGSVSVSNASIAVTGPLTDTQLRASAVPVSISSATVTANIGTTNGLALDATLTGGTARTKITDGTNNVAVKAASTAAATTDTALVVALSPNQSATAPVYVSIVEPPVGAIVTANSNNVKTIASSGSSDYQVVQGSATKLTGWYIYNNASLPRRVMFFNSSTTPASGATPLFSIIIPPFSAANLSFPSGAYNFTTGLSIGITTNLTAGSGGTTYAAANDIIMTLFYRS